MALDSTEPEKGVVSFKKDGVLRESSGFGWEGGQVRDC